MDCTLMKKELLAYHFGTLEKSAEADAHLLDCKDCLAAYLALKRAIESEARVDERPSQSVRERLRRDVAQTFRPSLAARVQRWLVRPMPRYQTVAFAAVAAAVIALLTIDRPPPPPAHPGTLVDSARAAPESYVFY